MTDAPAATQATPSASNDPYTYLGGSRTRAAILAGTGMLALLVSFLGVNLITEAAIPVATESGSRTIDDLVAGFFNEQWAAKVLALFLGFGGAMGGVFGAIAVLFLADFLEPRPQSRVLHLCLRLSAMALWPINIALWVFLIAVVALHEYLAATDRSSISGFVMVFPMFFLGPLSCAWVARSLCRAAARTSDRLTISSHNPRCERCGYDLTHVPQTGLCPECGLSCAESLTPDVRRRATAWERRRGIQPWFRTACHALLRPSSFYAGQCITSGMKSARWFVVPNLMAIWIVSLLWVMNLMLREMSGADDSEIAALVVVPWGLSWLAVLAGWTLSRAVCGVAILFFARWSLPDWRWPVKARCYETVVLSVFCLFNAGLITSYVFMGMWITEVQFKALGHRVMQLGIPLEILVIWLGNAALIVWWLLRYRKIFNAIRWSNF